MRPKALLLVLLEFKLTTDQDNIIYKITPLLNHPISDNKSYFYTYQIDLSCIF